MLTGSLKIVLMDCLWDTAINILTSQLFELSEDTYIKVFEQPSKFNSKFEGILYHTVLEFELDRTLKPTWFQTVILYMWKLTNYIRIDLVELVCFFFYTFSI